MNEEMKRNLLDPYVMRHELGGVASGLFTALDVFESRPGESDRARSLLRLSVERLKEILQRLEEAALAKNGIN